MNPKPWSLLFPFLLTCLICSQTTAQFRWPEEPDNLQVLPAGTGGAELGNYMREFATSLGVRCTHCHVGPEGAPLEELDFASDEKPTKETARQMFKMLQSINGDFLPLAVSGRQAHKVSCITCHRGVPRPIPLGTLLAEVVEEEGIERAVSHYRELRTQHYGGFAYDFREPVLAAVAVVLAGDDKYREALRILELNLEFFTDSSLTYTRIGQVYHALGEREKAVESLEKALELQPDNQLARRILETLQRK